MTKPLELRALPAAELETRLEELEEELFNLRFQHATGQLENYRRLGEVKRDIARVSTIIRERELGIEIEVEAEAEAPAKRPRRRRREEAGDEGPPEVGEDEIEDEGESE